MARTQIAQCDICGAHESPDNPIGATVTMRGKKKASSTPEYLSMFTLAVSSEPTEQLDLCMNCSAPLVHMLREHAARRRQAKRKAERVTAAPPVANDALQKIFNDAIKGH